jgi:hypothetical protein
MKINCLIAIWHTFYVRCRGLGKASIGRPVRGSPARPCRPGSCARRRRGSRLAYIACSPPSRLCPLKTRRRREPLHLDQSAAKRFLAPLRAEPLPVSATIQSVSTTLLASEEQRSPGQGGGRVERIGSVQQCEPAVGIEECRISRHRWYISPGRRRRDGRRQEDRGTAARAWLLRAKARADSGEHQTPPAAAVSYQKECRRRGS